MVAARREGILALAGRGLDGRGAKGGGMEGGGLEDGATGRQLGLGRMDEEGGRLADEGGERMEAGGRVAAAASLGGNMEIQAGR